MTSTLRRAGIAAVLALGLLAPAASAETFKTTMGHGRENVFNWEGQASGAPTIPGVLSNGCFDLDPGFRCDLVVFKLEGDGKLEATVEPTGAVSDPTNTYGFPDLKIALYASNGSGVHPDDAEPVAESNTGGAETIAADLKAGNYVLEIEAVQGQNIAYTGTSKGSGFAAPPAPVTPVTTPPVETTAPPATTTAPPAKTGKRAACVKKAKKKYKRNAKKRKKALKACRKQPV